MTDRSRRLFLTGAAALGATAACGQASADPRCSELPKLVHKVFFWLKNPDSSDDRDALIAGLKNLGAIEQIKGIHIGVPATTKERDVVNNSYQVSEMLLFDNAEDQDAYQVHPLHKQFVDECSHLWEKVVVYDSVEV